MKAIIMDNEVLVYATTEENSISIATLHKGQEVELGKVTQKKKKTWVETLLPGDQKGFIPGDTKIFAIRQATLMEASVDIKDAPNADAKAVRTAIKGEALTVYGVEKPEGAGDWFKVRDNSGKEGFIRTSTKLRVIQEISRSSANRNIITGLIFAAIGVLLTISNYKSGNTNSMVWISYAVIFFGLLQLGQGIYEMIKISRKKDQTK